MNNLLLCNFSDRHDSILETGKRNIMITIDGSKGEGGGQILRSSLALSLVTGQPFRIENIRAKRKKPGLMRQHLTAVKAAMQISSAKVDGEGIGSTEIEFTPGNVVPGEYTFSVGTAGSATLVLQTVLPALITASSPSRLVLEGGTHNPFAPPYDFIEKVFLPCLNRMGPTVACNLERRGFYPAGGGRFTVNIEPVEKLSPVDISERGDLIGQKAYAIMSNLSGNIGRRELKFVQKKLGFGKDCLQVIESKDSPGPGNVLLIEMRYSNITEIFSGFGELGVSSEQVAGKTVKQYENYDMAGVPVGRYLADQLLIPMVMAAGGKFRTLKPSKHTLTNISIVRRFMDCAIECEPTGGNAYEVSVG
ncbi:MAG TPA: RNA 3'-terminal phosphate cyclase [bacterium]|nr:RNA 3'-terminal phosphate cyclase [bacterium]